MPSVLDTPMTLCKTRRTQARATLKTNGNQAFFVRQFSGPVCSFPRHRSLVDGHSRLRSSLGPRANSFRRGPRGDL